VSINSQKMSFVQNGTLLFTASIHANAAYLDGCVSSPTLSPMPSLIMPIVSSPRVLLVALDANLLHRRLRHVGKDRLKQLLDDNLASGIDATRPGTVPDHCEPCIAAKQHRDPFPEVASSRATQPLERVHSDLHGPLAVRTTTGYRYWVTFIDDCIRYMMVYLLRHKSDTLDAFKHFKA